jgi:hypothetical protein
MPLSTTSEPVDLALAGLVLEEVWGVCSHCWRDRQLTAEGVLNEHRRWARWEMVRCSGSGLSPAE